MAGKRQKELDKPQKVRTTVEELEVLARLKGTVEWAILKRWMGRYINNLMRISFNLSYASPDFMVRHRGLTAEARAFKALVRVVEKAGVKLEKMESKK